jgi:hypothetical protein
MIPYASFEVQMFSLEIKDDNELGLLRDKIEQAVKAIHPEMKYDSDVNVEILEHAGKCFDDGKPNVENWVHDTIEEVA